jgi:opacity protein-like surface antigen
MKTPKKIITLLFLVVVTSAMAQSASRTYKSYFKGSIGMTDSQSEGSLSNLFKKGNITGLGMNLDSSLAYSFEGGFYTTDNWSLGFEYTAVNADAKSSKDLVNGAGEIQTLKTELGIPTPTTLAGLNEFEEKIDSDRFMFVINYECFLNENISVGLSGGVGLVNVEQGIKQKNKTTNQTIINSEVDDTVFAYQLGLNFGYHFNDGFTLYCGARYLASSNIDFNHKTFVLSDFDADVVSYDVGLRYSF